MLGAEAAFFVPAAGKILPPRHRADAAKSDERKKSLRVIVLSAILLTLSSIAPPNILRTDEFPADVTILSDRGGHNQPVTNGL